MTLYVSNLPSGITEEQLAELFEKFSDIEQIQLPKDSFSGLAKGYAFIRFKTEEGVYDAIHGLNHYVLEGSAIYVERAQNKAENYSQLRTDHR